MKKMQRKHWGKNQTFIHYKNSQQTRTIKAFPQPYKGHSEKPTANIILSVENLKSFPLSVILTVSLSYMALIMLSYVPSLCMFLTLWRVFNHKWMLNFGKKSFLLLLR